jgi:2-succinyl-6-hydroxy-2,4-cyclohexadiene-1-carboxylate synthase
VADLHATHLGAGDRVALLHGFTQTSACWGTLADDLAVDHEVVLVDLPRHGASASVPGDLVATAPRLAEAIGSAVVVGYSMGARYALTLAVERPEVVRGLVLVSGTAGIEDPEARAERRVADELRAQSLEEHGLEAFLDEWLAQPLFEDVPPDRSCREARLLNAPGALAASLREAGTGSMAPLWDRLGAVHVPVLLITGGRDERYGQHARRMASLLGGPVTHVVVPDAGHAVHLVDPAAVLAAIRAWP